MLPQTTAAAAATTTTMTTTNNHIDDDVIVAAFVFVFVVDNIDDDENQYGRTPSYPTEKKNHTQLMYRIMAYECILIVFLASVVLLTYY